MLYRKVCCYEARGLFKWGYTQAFAQGDRGGLGVVWGSFCAIVVALWLHLKGLPGL